MANFKSITELPVANSSNGVNLIINDNGAAKQIAASAVGAQADWAETNENSPAFIKNKPSKELIFEWNFEADEDPSNCVFEILENIDEDLSWLTSMSDSSTDWEVEMSTYGMVQTYNNNDGTYSITIYPDVYTTVIIDNKSPYCLRTQSNEQMSCWIYAPAPEDYLNNWDLAYVEMDGRLDIYNHAQYNFEDDWQLTNVSKGGSIVMSSYPPFKSVKIYKIIK